MAAGYWPDGYWAKEYWAVNYWPAGLVDNAIIGNITFTIRPIASNLSFETSIRGFVPITITPIAGMLFRLPGEQDAHDRRRRTNRIYEG